MKHVFRRNRTFNIGKETTMTQAREPAGSPIGGQFDTSKHNMKHVFRRNRTFNIGKETTMTQAREPAGSPIGGQFDTSKHKKTAIVLPSDHAKKVLPIVLITSGLALAACGTTVHSSHTVAPKPTAVTSQYGFSETKTLPDGDHDLLIPHMGVASPSITSLAMIDGNFRDELLNPKDWAYSSQFGKYIFVGPYTHGYNKASIISSKMVAWDWSYASQMIANYQQSAPSTLDGYNFALDGQIPVVNKLADNIISGNLSQNHPVISDDTPSEATVIESLVGYFTKAQLGTSNLTHGLIGTCVPYPYEVSLPSGKPDALNGALTPKHEEFVQFGNPNVIFLLPSQQTQMVLDGILSLLVSLSRKDDQC